MAKTIDIFVKSYYNDFWLLQLSLKTIARNVTGYNKIIILIPLSQKAHFDTRNMPPNTEIHYVNEYGNGYLYQQVCKVNAFKYSYADYILYSDSDCIFEHKIDLQEFIIDDQPEILYTNWDKVGDAICWRGCTEAFMGEPVPYEFMRRLQLIYHRSTLCAIAKQYPDLEQRVMSSERFSEFNFLGAWAYKNERGKYTFINTDNWSYTIPKAVQLWSHASKDGDLVHIQEWIRTLETIMDAFGVPVPKK